MNKHFQKSAFTDQDSIEFWDHVYDSREFFGDCFRKRMSKALAWLDELVLSRKSSFLEIGSGAGRLTSEVAKKGQRIFGLDYSYGMLAKNNRTYNRENGLMIPFLQGDIQSLPFGDSSFDAVICLGVITYVKSEEKALRELARILKPDGMLILSFVNKARLVRALDLPLLSKRILQKTLNSNIVLWKKNTKINDSSDSKSYFIPTIRKSLEMIGFTIMEYETITLDLFTLFGREILPRKVSVAISLFFDRFLNVPIIESFGGMCMFKAIKTK